MLLGSAFPYSIDVDWMSYLITAVVAYLLGSIPTGFLVGKAKGIDLRKVGSGNIGATNALRILGKKAGIAVLVIDALKGFVACFWAAPAVQTLLKAPAPEHRDHLLVMAAACAVLGHMYTCWLYFKGGKGIATTGGVFAALAPTAVLLTLAGWIVVFVTTRYVSVASIAAAFLLPVMVWWRGGSLLLVALTTGISILALWKHRENMRRLMKGTENRFDFRGKKDSNHPKSS